MTDKKITQLTALTGANAVAGDQLAIVDVSDTTMSASGTTKKIALSELQAAPLSAGTANGVAYLNGSKVLTTGSALTFDASGNLGVGTTSPACRVEINNGARVAEVRIGDTSGRDLVLRGGTASTELQIGSSDSRALTFITNDTERARIDSSGNLIQKVNTTAATLATNGTLTFSIVDNSTLRISVRGSDGTTRTATVALT